MQLGFTLQGRYKGPTLAGFPHLGKKQNTKLDGAIHQATLEDLHKNIIRSYHINKLVGTERNHKFGI